MTRISRQTTRNIFAWPLLLGLATLVGLVLGLTGDGLRDMAAWTLLGLAPLVILGALLRRTPDSPSSPR